MMLENVAVVLVEPRFPENIGMVARACANMGVNELVVVAPERWNPEKSVPLATPKGVPVLESVRHEDTLAAALAPYTLVLGTTARTGGWRRQILSPETAAPVVQQEVAAGGRVAIVFGREDRGLTNEETEVCSRLVTIPTSEASSLNLAQAVLILLYECFKLSDARPFHKSAGALSRVVTHEEQEILFAALQDTLLDIDYLREDNPDYFMLPVRRFMQKASLRRHEFDMLMGICRQVRRLARVAAEKEDRDASA
ncbi:tRNA/rRNA methyltransferase (SpoU) [Oleidesulfovibrio alaskensis G20]|jgi:tRNA/rRNA methyltransferase|uniref:tRNA (cytidine/uridine-2'-O-)-methyltransferase TrmJ n=2 Tax=Oleidesulfovibrio alaskensis TaxID=58180 RepID=Q313X1_OLEA2|nr:tRNA/rRNA methyltransferase (SpoU) [Oleidesulfovibrio alaskensis G20]